MKRKRSKMWEYLEASGVLEKGNENEIKAIKREYRKKYYLEYKRMSRTEMPEYTIRLSKKNGEYSKILNASRKHKRTVTRFIRESALAYIDQRFLVPDPILIADLEIILSNCLNEINKIVDKKTNFIWGTENKIESIEKRIIKLEQEINEVFRNPKQVK